MTTLRQATAADAQAILELRRLDLIGGERRDHLLRERLADD
jgi:hypothetical protein